MGFSLRGRASAADAVPRPVEATEVTDNEATRVGVYLFALALFAVGAGIVTAAWAAAAGSVDVLTAVVAVAVGLLAAATVRVAPQWERVAILRLGRFSRIAGPGPYVVVPFVDYAAMHIDHRIMNSSFSAEAALTADLVPVDVDAILFWMVWDAKKACLEVENYPKAVLRSAQTAMRDAIGQVNLADLSLRRRQIDRELQEVMGAKCEEWGVTVMSVEIRDVKVPPELEDALSKEAQAERERNARTILAEVEKDISEMFVEAAEVYERKPVAMKLRAMNLAYEGAREGKGILLAPSGLADGFDLGKILED
ncbi:slipin family protein [Adlercreutzia faecimuris]|uniref:Slipin family protein n=1 Tax=Adlercreutzia faecimuris TaxID=2897341 RepID=A0ABS9WFR1_9ACTN|nr:slipin family protein [Adlercreutzia sp. JBNU-10]MCI2241699.1 slipin family protein [Adlercreutzia sp. JBNU-10]